MQSPGGAAAANSSFFSSNFGVLLAFIIASCSLFQINQAVVTIPKNHTIPAVFGFGDSIIDPGNNNNIGTVVKCNFHPYGKDFVGGIPTGRFCNGKVPTDFFVGDLGIKEYLPAYLDPTLGPQDLLTGVSFASGGAGYDPLTSKIASVLSFSDQLKLFKEYIEKLKMIAGEERAKTIIAKSLYIIVAGSDDIANTYFPTPFRKNYDVSSYTDLMLRSALNFIQELYNLGARTMAVLDVPPIGCVPSQRTIAGGTERNCAEKYNQAALLFNSKLSSQIDSLDKKLPRSKIVAVEIYKPLLDIIQNPNSYGFEEVRDGCCGTGKIEVSILCNDLVPVTCPDDTKYLFWDSYHPTQSGYRVLTTSILQKYANSSSSSTFAVLIVFIIASCFLFQINQAVITLPKNLTIPAVFGFGDSILDPGNNNNIGTVVKCNFHPYGKDFMGGIPTGRFCNGKVPTDFFVGDLGIKEYLPAYLDPTLGPQDLLTGVSFASGGAGYDPLTSQIASVLSLSDQLKLSEEYKEKLKMITGEERARTIIAESLYVLIAGSDDIANTYFSTPFRKNYNIPSYTDLMLRSALNFIQELYNLGARRIAVLNAPPIGCVPSQRTLAGGKERNCAEKYNQAALLFNSKLSSQIESLDKKLPRSKIVAVEIYKPLFDIIQNPNSYGFEESRVGCCGTGKIEVSILCNDLVPVTCPDDTKYLFWDSYHPTEHGYRVLTTIVLQKLINRLI
ncbi:uncharacterized protein LOC122658342 [Telopea speciosissima]|uniref:uncharacterized protein LOC122658342 n=1 Tax=Telopea speciosissima TaxID=54955 RepID=UPI001CC7DEB0|nr:uncharacterized protein LOC122658342 [Telopea speciosissima]